jgi:dTDP-L-rhamnose 4-epimerase
MPKRILITGGAGFIGSRLALQLVSKGYTVTVLDNLSPQIHGNDPIVTSPLYNSIKDKVVFIKGSVTNEEDWYNAMKGQNIIVHFAAETGTGQSMYQIKKYVDVNVAGTALMLDMLTNSNHQVSRVIVASSRAIYGEGCYYSNDLKKNVYPNSRKLEDLEKGDFEVKYPASNEVLELMPTSEDAVINPVSVYAITKYNQEQMCMTVCKSIGVEAVALRYQNVYGPGQSLSNPYTGILSIFSTLIKSGKDINIFEDGKESRDFVYIDDVIDATILAIEHKDAANESFNVGSGVATSVSEVVACLLKNYQSNVATSISGKFRVGDIRHCYADLSKTKKVLGFSPKISFEEGVTTFCNWVNSQKVLTNDRYADSILELKEKGLYR